MSTYYSATHKPRRHRAKRRTVIMTAVVGVVVLAAGVAIAMVLLRSPVSGTVSTVNQSQGWNAGVQRGTDPLVTANGATCTLTYGATPQAPITITMTGAWPGASCLFAPGFKVTSGQPVKLYDFEVTGLPQGWTAGLDSTSPCGLEYPVGGNGSLLRFRIDVADDAPLASGSIPITADAVTVPSSLWEGCA